MGGQKMQEVRHQIIGDFVSQLYLLNLLDERFDLYQMVVSEMGFDAVCFSFEPHSFIKPKIQYPPIFKISTKFPPDFIKIYSEEKWFKHDFTIREISEGNLQAKDWKQKEHSGELKDKEIALIQLARKQFKINNAITIPTMNNTIGMAGSSILSFGNDDNFTSLKQKNLNTLIVCSRVFSDIILQQPSDFSRTFVFPNLPQITPKERIVLRDLVSQKSLQQLGVAEGMSESTVSNHLSRLCKKFKVRKTSDLKYLLISLNILGGYPRTKD